MKILITGATGLVGQEIVKQLIEKNIEIHYLTTNKNKIKNESFYKGFYWNSDKNYMDKLALVGITHIIHLAGASIAERWTPEYKKEILDSRVLYSNLLFKNLLETQNEVKQIITASAIGIYKSDENYRYNEEDIIENNSFLSEVTQEWEKSTSQFKKLNIDVCTLRIGLVMAIEGGMLPKVVAPIKLGLGAAMGNGKQWQSWVHVKDLARMFIFSIENNLTGIYNGVGSFPVTNEEMTKILAKTLKKPYFLPNVPAFVLKLMLGEMHILLLESQKVSNEKIVHAGFNFEYNYFEEAADSFFKLE